MFTILDILLGSDKYWKRKNLRSRPQEHPTFGANRSDSAGLEKELNMTADQFYMTLTIFFITYSIFGENNQSPENR